MILFFTYLTEIINNLNEFTLRSGRVLSPNHPTVLESVNYGWFYININNPNQIKIIEQTLGQQLPTTSFMNPNWLCIFLKEDQYIKLSSDFYITPSTASDKYISTELLSSDASENKSYLIHAQHDYFNHTNMTEYYTDYYISSDLPDLSDPSVLSVELLEKGPELLNRWATGYAQSSSQFLTYSGNLLITNRPIHSHGIRGDNVIVTMLDSGIDTKQCYFRDDEREVPFNSDDLDHRKIVRYEALADMMDSNAGHGTHVAGILTANALCDCATKTGMTKPPPKNKSAKNASLLSQNFFDSDNKAGVRFEKGGPKCYSEFGFNNGCRCSASMYNGHAPNSKIYFVDGGLSNDPTTLIPHIDYKRILMKAKQFHSKIMSNSWGFPPSKAGFRHMFDTIAYENPDMLLIFGAGNTRKMNDMYTPANSKNCVAVGGTSNSYLSALEKEPNGHYVFVYKQTEYEVLFAPWSESLFELLKKDPVPNFRNLPLSSSFDSKSDGQICFARSSTCEVVQSASNAACAALLLPFKSSDEEPNSDSKSSSKLLYFEETDEFNMTNFLLGLNHNKRENVMRCPPVNMSVFFTKSSNLIRELKDGQTASIGINFFKESDDYKVSRFNSGGPSDTGLMKPDLMAPGADITSTHSSMKTFRSCDASSLLTKSGTSMAVPVVSAAAAMILQYFRDGFFPYFLTPSASLMKAMLINCAAPRNAEPNLHVGYGLIHLDKVLAFSDSDFRLLIAESISITENFALSANFKIGAEKVPLCISMSWNDPPISIESELPVFADLDMLLVTPSHKVLRMNDNRVTSKRIFVNEPEDGQYQIQVVCPILYKPGVVVNFSVVATGGFYQSELLDFNPIQFQREKCDVGKTGYQCDENVISLSIGKLEAIELKPRTYVHMMIEMPEINENFLNISVELDRAHGAIVQVEIAGGQTHKFGGTLIHFSKIKKKKTEFRIYNEHESLIKKNDIVYLSFYSATISPSNLKISYKIDKNSSANSQSSSIVALKMVDYKPNAVDYEKIRNTATYKLAPSKRPLPTADYDKNDLFELPFFTPDFIFFSAMILFVVVFFCIMIYSFHDRRHIGKPNDRMLENLKNMENNFDDDERFDDIEFKEVPEEP